MIGSAELLSMQQCISTESFVFFSHLNKSLFAHEQDLCCIPHPLCVLMHSSVSQGRHVSAEQEKCINISVHTKSHFCSVLSVSCSWTQHKVRNNSTLHTMKRRHLQGLFKWISKESLQTIFVPPFLKVSFEL